MIVDTTINRSLAAQILVFDGWEQVENEEVSELWWKKGSINIVVEQRPCGVRVCVTDPTFQSLWSSSFSCEDISDFAEAMIRMNEG